MKTVGHGGNMKGYRVGLLAVTVLLTACGKKDASGIYVLANDNEVTLVQIIEGQDEKLTGRIQVNSIGTDGQVSEKTSSFEGSASGNDLLVRPTSEWLGGLQASGTYDSNSITLTGQGFTFSAKRSDLEKYQSAVEHLKWVASDRANKRAQLQAQFQTSDKATQVQQIAANISGAVGRLNDAVGRSPDFAQMASANTAKVQRMLQAAPSMGEVQRGQLDVAANQVVVGSNQIEVSRQQYANGLNSIIEGVKADADRMTRLCAGNPSGALFQSCKNGLAAVNEFAAAVAKGRTSFTPQKVRIEAEIKRQEELAAKIDG
jgi:hypothetical protein